MKAYGRMDMQISAVCRRSRCEEKQHVPDWQRGCVGPTASMDVMEKIKVVRVEVFTAVTM
jgi:hypothetical protein